MKYRALQIIASYFKILALITGGFGLIVTYLLSIRAAWPWATLEFLLIGLALTALNVLILLAISQLINLFLDIHEDLKQITTNIKKTTE